MTKILYIEPGEVITSIVDRLVAEKARNIFLVIPSHAIFWHNVVNLKLLKRETNNLNKNVALVNPDRVKRELAERTGFLIISELPSGTSRDEAKNYKIEDSLENMLLADESSKNRDSGDAKPQKVSDIIWSPIQRHSPSRFIKNRKDKVLESLPTETKEKLDHLAVKVNGERPMDFKDIRGGPKDRDAGLEEVWHSKQKSEKEKDNMEREFFDRKFFEERLRESGQGEEIRYEVPEKIGGKHLRQYAPKISSHIFTVIFIVILTIAGGVSFVVLPQAEIHIFRRVELLPVDLRITIASEIDSIDFEKLKIPGQAVKTTMKIENKFLSSGEKEVEKKAQGKITIYNELDSMPQPMIPSRFQEEKSGKIFWSTKSIIVPGAAIKDGKVIPGTIEIDTVASEAGNDFNIECSKNTPCNFTIPAWRSTVKFNKLYAKSFSPLMGGSIGKAKIATQEDFNRAKEDTISQLRNEIKNALLQKVPPDLYFLEEGLQEKIITSGASVKVGDVAESFMFEVEMELSSFVFNKNDINSLIDYHLKDKLSDQKGLVPDVEKFSFNVNRNDDNIEVRVAGDKNIVWKINPESIKKDILNKDKGGLQQYFNNIQGVENVRVDLWPFWVKKTPKNGDKVKIIIEK